MSKLDSYTDNSNLQKYDLHIHSKYSYDSLATPKRIIKIAKKLGLKGIAITDHDTIKGAVEASKIAKDIEIIIGSEIKTEKGDVIGLFLEEEIISRRFEEVVDEIKDQNGFVILPHPYKTFDYVPDSILNKIDAIEILNGRISHELNNKAQKLAYDKKILFTGGSDAHLAKNVGSIVTIFDEDIESLTVHNIDKELKKAGVRGVVTPHYTHYYTTVLGNIRKKRYAKLGKMFIKGTLKMSGVAKK